MVSVYSNCAFESFKIEGRYKHSKSPAEREYMELIGEVILPNAVSGDNKALVEVIFDQLVKLASNEMSNPIFVMEAISTASDIRGKVVDGDEKILEGLLNAASRGVSNGTSSLFESAAKHMLEFVLPSVDDARKTPNDDIWGVSKQPYHNHVSSKEPFSNLFTINIFTYATNRTEN